MARLRWRKTIVRTFLDSPACALVASLALLAPQTAAAQGPGIVPLITEHTIESSLSPSFGAITTLAVGESGDAAFTTGGGSALFFRSGHGNWPAATVSRVMQVGDESPLFPGGRVASFTQGLVVNRSGIVVFNVTINLPTGGVASALYAYDSGSLHLLASDVSSGFAALAINDTGTIAYRRTTPTGTSFHLVKPDGTHVRLVGVGDPAPGTTATFVNTMSTGAGALNNGDELLFRSPLSNGNTGFFAANETGVRKLVISGESLPGGAGVVTTLPVAAVWSDLGIATLTVNNTIWRTSPTGLTRLVGPGDLPPPGMTGAVQFATLLTGNPAGQVLTLITASGRRGIIRYGDAAATLMALDAGTGDGPIFLSLNGSGSGVSNPNVVMNALGDIVFSGTLRTTGIPRPAIFGSAGAGVMNLVLNDQAAPLSGETYSLQTTGIVPGLWITSSLEVVFTSPLRNGPAGSGTFRVGLGDAAALVTTADPLPSGATTLFSSVSGAGDFVSFSARRAGGQSSLGLHHIAAHRTAILVTEGDGAPSSGAARFQVFGTFQVNASGRVAFVSSLVGTPAASGVFAIGLDEPLQKLALEGEPAPGGGALGSLLLAGSGSHTDAGAVLFLAGSNIYVATPAGTLQKIIAVGDALPGGGTYQIPGLALQGVRAAIGQDGHIAFAGALGVFLKPPDGPLIAVARTGTTSIGTFTAFTLPTAARMNRLGSFPFFAAFTSAGVTRYGLFHGSAAGWSPIALGGDAAPGGGTFPVQQLTPTVALPWAAQINDLDDVAFSTLAAAGAGGTYIRRGTSGTLEPAALIGQPAPGSSGPFVLLGTPALGDSGDLAISGSAPAPGGLLSLNTGVWHLTTDGILRDIAASGTVDPAFGGGDIVSATGSFTWNSQRRFAVTSMISGGPFLSGVFLYVPESATPTPPGTGVRVTPADSVTGTSPVTLTFAEVTSGGVTTLTLSASGPALPSAFAPGAPVVFYNVASTAHFNGPIAVCVDTTGTAFPSSNLRLLHYTGGEWVDVTTSVAGTVVCGETTSLSTFTVASQVNPSPTAVAGDNQIVESGAGGATVTLNGSASSDPDGEALTFVWREGATVVGNAAVTIVTRGVGAYTFTLTVTDTHGLSSSSSVQVVVRDTIAPALTVPAPIEQLSPGPDGVTVSFTASALDTVSGSVAVECSPASGSVFPAGTTTVTCSATDAARNTATKSFTVTISQGNDSRMTGRGHFAADGIHHFFGFRVAQRSLNDAGRFQYFTTSASDPTALATAAADANDDASYARVPSHVSGWFEATTLAVYFDESPTETAGGIRPADRAVIVGVGTWNGITGHTFEAVATDVGEPGTARDTFAVVIRDGDGAVVAQTAGTIDLGNINSTRVRR